MSSVKLNYPHPYILSATPDLEEFTDSLSDNTSQSQLEELNSETTGLISSNNIEERILHQKRDSTGCFKHNHHPKQAHCVTEAQLDRLNLLIKMIRNGNYKEFIQLLERRGLNHLLNVFVDGQTALHYSLIYGRSLSWCKQLVLNGANPNLTNRSGWHPIHLAAFNGSRETMLYLIDCIIN